MKIELYFSALSAILTIIGVLYGLWYNEIQQIKKLGNSEHPENKLTKEEISGCIYSKLFPICLISFFTVALFAKDVIQIFISSFLVISSGIDNTTYDPVQAVFVFLVILILFLCILLIRDIVKMFMILSRLNNK
jgi:hypothetical protein